ncbi:MAG: hypothetical protein M3Q03_00500, partial [Chloroflexota bacterium]|nr:hypothetical protein [Chloroflexota bacterium]
LTARLGAVERRRGHGPWRPPVTWIEAVRPGEDGRRDEARGAGTAMRVIVQREVAASGRFNVLPLITTSVVADGEGIAEAAGRTWWFALTDDDSGGTRATVPGREVASWVG